MRLFDRKAEVIINNRRFAYPDFDIDFSIALDQEAEPNQSSLSLYNVSDTSIAFMKYGSEIIINAGYDKDVGTVFKGQLFWSEKQELETERKVNIIAGDAAQKWMTKTANKKYNGKIKASRVIKDLLSIFGVEIAFFELNKDVEYEKGLTISESVQSALRKIVIDDCESRLYVLNGRVFIRKPGTGYNIQFTLNERSGLIGTPQRLDKDNKIGYTVFSLLNHRLSINSIIIINSKTANGRFRVDKVIHNMDRSSFISQMEVFPA